MNSSDSALLEDLPVCERRGCGEAGSIAFVHSFIQGLTEGHYEQGPKGEEVWLPGEELVLCEGCFEDSYDYMVSNIQKMSRGEIRVPLDDTYNL